MDIRQTLPRGLAIAALALSSCAARVDRAAVTAAPVAAAMVPISVEDDSVAAPSAETSFAPPAPPTEILLPPPIRRAEPVPLDPTKRGGPTSCPSAWELIHMDCLHIACCPIGTVCGPAEPPL